MSRCPFSGVELRAQVRAGFT